MSVNYDRRSWREEQSGYHSVKSAHNLIQRIKGTWSLDNTSGFWRKLWNLKIPPKVWNFLSRALTGCLPTRSQLYLKRVEVSLECSVCSSGREIVQHILVDWVFLLLVLILLGCYADMGNYDGWFPKLLEDSNREVVELAVMVCWTVWKAQNGRYYNQHI